MTGQQVMQVHPSSTPGTGMLKVLRMLLVLYTWFMAAVLAYGIARLTSKFCHTYRSNFHDTLISQQIQTRYLAPRPSDSSIF